MILSSAQNAKVNFAMLQAAGKRFGFIVEDNRSFCLDEQRISSTAIREALAKDDYSMRKIYSASLIVFLVV